MTPLGEVGLVIKDHLAPESSYGLVQARTAAFLTFLIHAFS